ncbi:MAG: hypothetical protein ACXWV9_05920 [Flavisolibacter sp.]
MKKFQWVAIKAMALFLILPSCKKEKTDAAPVPLLSIDASVHPSYGQLIKFAEGNLGKIHTWGGNSNELIASSENTFIKINPGNSTISKISDVAGLFIQRSADQHSIIFAGTVNGNNGYYDLNIDTKVITPLISLDANSGSNFSVANNDMFLYSGSLVSTGRPCTSMFDFWCGTGTTLTNTSFYHYNKATGSSMSLPGKRFVTFSKDYTKALLSDTSGNNGYKYVVFDFTTQKITDSLIIPWTRPEHGSFYWDNTLLFAYSDFITHEIVVLNAFTDKEIHRFQSQLSRFSGTDKKLVWSADGSKIYYTGACKTADCTTAINMIEINTGIEKKLVYTTSNAFQTSPFIGILPSEDDKKLVFTSENKTYLKLL